MLSLLLSATLLGAAPAAPPESPAAPRASVSSRAPILAGVGAGLTLTGTLVWLVANVQEGVVASRPGSPAEIQVARWRVQQTQLGAVGLTIVGVCTVGIAAAMERWVPPSPGAVVAAPLVLPGGGGGLALAGRWP